VTGARLNHRVGSWKPEIRPCLEEGFTFEHTDLQEASTAGPRVTTGEVTKHFAASVERHGEATSAQHLAAIAPSALQRLAPSTLQRLAPSTLKRKRPARCSGSAEHDAALGAKHVAASVNGQRWRPGTVQR
jgi:hypothetical protein